MRDTIDPLVNVVIPVFNKVNTIARTIESVKHQTLNNLSCYVVDNNSTDDSRRAIETAIIGDARFKTNNCPTQGVAHARNHGIRLGTAPFVCCLDGDDAIEPRFLEACVAELQKDRSLGMAYTGLYFITPGKKEGLSPWPPQFDANEQIAGRDQVPTCCVFRRVMWARLGGYRQKYCDPALGAGAEDAEFWSRATAMGWNAKKVTDGGLFIYSWQSGLVSGNKEYHQPNFLVLHPWVKDGIHPFASYATPKNNISHPVRQYDQPAVSVVIPVCGAHLDLIVDALDSLEGQTYRGWEAIVVLDLDYSSDAKSIQSVQMIADYVTKVEYLVKAFPFVRLTHTTKTGEAPKGAGYARNLGVKMARAPLLLFLDADDTLHPDCIKKMLDAYAIEPSIVYTDYIGKAYIDDKLAQKMQDENRLLERQKDGWSIIAYRSFDYDCERAQRQPDRDTYVWNLCTSLTPKVWHEQIGGFDESMSTWEDWDYWIRMARAGKCFTRIPEQLVGYRFYSGERRERALKDREYENLIKYMLGKYKDESVMPCSSCGKKGRPVVSMPAQQPAGNQPNRATVVDSDFVLVAYEHPNRGQHPVVGGHVFPARLSGLNMVQSMGGFRIHYGYRGGGDRFYVHQRDIASQPHLFHVIPIAPPVAEQDKAPILPPPPTVTAVVQAPDDLVKIPGISVLVAQALNTIGIHTVDDLLKAGTEGLSKIKGIGPTRAASILSHARTMASK